jgi:hypothetical protein
MMRLKKSSKTKDNKIVQETSGSRFQSRFANDSDDDEIARPAFASRFEDSDDELDVILPKVESTARPTGLPPVRGIPRRAGEEDGDSTDLSDSESLTEPASPLPPVPSVRDVNKAHVPSPPKGSLITSPNEQNTGLSSSRFAPKANPPPASEKTPKRPSFISSISGQSQSWHSRRFSSFGSGNPAEESRKPYEGQRPQGKLRRKGQPGTTPNLSPQQAKIQRILAAGDPISSSSWQLPASPVERNGQLATSGGVLNSDVPAENVLNMGSGSTTTAAPTIAPTAVDTDELERLKVTREKKKRFGKLRKAFGMKA